MSFLDPSSYFDYSHFAHAALFKDCRYPWEALLALKKYLAAYSFIPVNPADFPQTYLIHPETISIGQGTVLEPGAYIHGPCILGEGCVVRHGAYLRGHVIAGNRCVLGHDSEIKNSIFLDDVAAAHFAYVGDSILGNHVNLGAGTKCANLRLDRGLIKIHTPQEMYATQMKKLGALIGDYAQLGCNSVTNPGTLIGPHALIAPCLNVGGVIPAYSFVQSQQSLKISSLKKEPS